MKHFVCIMHLYLYLCLGTDLKGNTFYLLSPYELLPFPFMEDETEAKRTKCVSNLPDHTADKEQSWALSVAVWVQSLCLHLLSFSGSDKS